MVLCERKQVNFIFYTCTPSHSHTHTLTSSHIHTIIEAVNSCLEVMQENSRSHVPCEEGRGEGVEEGEWRRGSGGEGVEGRERGEEGRGGGVEGEGVRRRACRVT